MNGKYVIVRGDRSGVFAGTLESQNGSSTIRALEKAYADL